MEKVPLYWESLNMLTDKNATCTAGLEKFLNGATYTAMPIEIQDNILTGKGPEAAMKFAVAIVSLLLGKRCRRQGLKRTSSNSGLDVGVQYGITRLSLPIVSLPFL